ncbi:SRPBCC family protein [Kallotenue papyrolyticum]|uniref:SRPBCC family protein n=1 Tax=Kallotenue papyrolyticum TaxID=1325125 RepID=UPI0004928B59|nr:SRPBCC family protein [Kallotenue papyrolyticum]
MPIAEKTIIVSAPVEQVYRFWTQFERFPEFMENITSVTKTGERTSHWVAKGPLGSSVEWDAETTLLEENRRIAWNSRDSGDITTSGQVTFTELGTNQTQITVTLKYEPPAGKAGELVAKIFSDPQRQLEEDLERFKAVVNQQRTTTGRDPSAQQREMGSV